jgi:hypothetical protein
MDKVQRIDRSNTAPSSKTFRDEFSSLITIRVGADETVLHVVPICFIEVMESS